MAFFVILQTSRPTAHWIFLIADPAAVPLKCLLLKLVSVPAVSFYSNFTFVGVVSLQTTVWRIWRTFDFEDVLLGHCAETLSDCTFADGQHLTPMARAIIEGFTKTSPCQRPTTVRHLQQKHHVLGKADI